jgi:DNA-binding NtrC family response regulator
MAALALVSSLHPTGPPSGALLYPSPRSGSGLPQSRAIPVEGFLLGRGELVFDSPFDDPTMSPRHAEVRRDGSGDVIRDLSAKGGTRLNGAALREEHTLADGDVLRLGDTVLLYTLPERPPAIRGERPGASAGAAAELIGTTASIGAVRHSTEAVAPHLRTVVVTGETGTGKEIVARMLHQQSGRAGPFVAVNCGGFTDGLLASELFGHVRGAFTGAVQEQQGLFRAARGGTLLLDEAGDIPLALQATLLRVLETWEVRPVGSSRDVTVDVRVVAASNRELLSLVQQGLFRADLYARLAQWVIRIPPLRDRRADIPAISRALLARLGAAGRRLTADLEEALLLHPWPLNVRGLLNVLSIAVIASPPDQPLGMSAEVRAALQDNRIEHAAPRQEAPAVALDRPALEALLARFGGRVAEMARHVGVSRPKLYRLLWSVGLDPATFRGLPRAPSEPG